MQEPDHRPAARGSGGDHMAVVPPPSPGDAGSACPDLERHSRSPAGPMIAGTRIRATGLTMCGRNWPRSRIALGASLFAHLLVAAGVSSWSRSPPVSVASDEITVSLILTSPEEESVPADAASNPASGSDSIEPRRPKASAPGPSSGDLPEILPAPRSQTPPPPPGQPSVQSAVSLPREEPPYSANPLPQPAEPRPADRPATEPVPETSSRAPSAEAPSAADLPLPPLPVARAPLAPSSPRRRSIAAPQRSGPPESRTGQNGAPSPSSVAGPAAHGVPNQTPPRPVGGAIRQPVYPAAAVRRREEGRVIIRVDVAPDGTPASVAVMHESGFPRLDEASVVAVQNSRFMPATRDGQPVAGVAEVPIVFRLQ
jgi:periplasmic protein TonB